MLQQKFDLKANGTSDKKSLWKRRAKGKIFALEAKVVKTLC